MSEEINEQLKAKLRESGDEGEDPYGTVSPEDDPTAKKETGDAAVTGGDPATEEKKPEEGDSPDPSESEDVDGEKAPEPEKVEEKPTEEKMDLTCPYCGQPLIEKDLSGTHWFSHASGSCKALFKGEEELKTKQSEAREAAEEAARAQAAEEARIAKLKAEEAKQREARERPIREAAEEVAKVFQTMADDATKQMLDRQKQLLDDAGKALQDLLKQNEERKNGVKMPDRSAISDAIDTYNNKLKTCSEEDTNRAVYEMFVTSYNTLLRCYDEAQRSLADLQTQTARITKTLKEQEKVLLERMEKLTSNDKEYEDIQKDIEAADLGVIHRLDIQLKTLEQLYFRRFG